MANSNDLRKWRDMLTYYLKLEEKHPQWKAKHLYADVAHEFYLSQSRTEKIIVSMLKGSKP